MKHIGDYLIEEIEQMTPDLFNALFENHDCVESDGLPCIWCNEMRQRSGGVEVKYNSHAENN